jgi:hypothetical protein
MGVLVQVENGDKPFWGNRNLMQPMRGLQGLSFLVLNWGGGGEGEFFVYFCSQCVLSIFSRCSHQVLKMFLKLPNVFHETFPRAPHVLSHIV